MALVVIACVLLAAAFGFWIFSAPAEPAVYREREIRIAAWQERKKAVYDNLKDLHFEHLAGKLTDDDFQRTRSMLEAEAAATVAALEREEGAGVA